MVYPGRFEDGGITELDIGRGRSLPSTLLADLFVEARPGSLSLTADSRVPARQAFS